MCLCGRVYICDYLVECVLLCVCLRVLVSWCFCLCCFGVDCVFVLVRVSARLC